MYFRDDEAPYVLQFLEQYNHQIINVKKLKYEQM